MARVHHKQGTRRSLAHVCVCEECMCVCVSACHAGTCSPQLEGDVQDSPRLSDVSCAPYVCTEVSCVGKPIARRPPCPLTSTVLRETCMLESGMLPMTENTY